MSEPWPPAGLSTEVKPPSPPSSAVLGYGLFADRPSPGPAGSRWFSKDGTVEVVSDGTAWRPMIDGTEGTEPPAFGTWTTFGAGIATFAPQAGTLVLAGYGNSASVNLLMGASQPKPGGTSYAVQAHLQGFPAPMAAGSPTDARGAFGVGIRDSVSGYTFVFGVQGNDFVSCMFVAGFDGLGGIDVQINSTALPTGSRGIWFEFDYDDTTGLTVFSGQDGKNFSQIWSRGPFGHTELVFAALQSRQVSAVLDSWKVLT